MQIYPGDRLILAIQSDLDFPPGHKPAIKVNFNVKIIENLGILKKVSNEGNHSFYFFIDTDLL